MVDHIEKEAVAELEMEQFAGPIHIIDTKMEARKAITKLKKEKILGFDTESRPSFEKGVRYQVSLLQLATDKECYLFRLNLIGISKGLKELLESPEILKIALSANDDITGLKRRESMEPKGFVELQRLAPGYGIKDSSLQKIYAILFGKRISKSQRLSNWEAKALSPAQQAYAALDAWATLRIYRHFSSLPNPEPIQFALI